MFEFILLLPIAFLAYIFYYRKFPKRLYGLQGYVGTAGQGKTYSAVQEVLRLYKAYKGNIYIVSNLEIKYNGIKISNDLKYTSQLLQDYDKPCLVLIDELPSIFNARNWKDFPPELFAKITQLRKGHGMRILYTAQRFFMIDKALRSITDYIYLCNCFFNGMFWVRKCLPQSIDEVSGKLLSGQKYLNSRCYFLHKSVYESYDTLNICTKFD